MRIAVMKFGGTSVADPEAIRRVAGIVQAEIARGSRPVVVVSAMSGVTDRLLALAAAATRGDEEAVTNGLRELFDRHVAAAADLAPPGEVDDLVADLRARFEALRAVLAAVAILREATPRAVDEIASAGELCSSRIAAAALQHAGVKAVWIDARGVIVTDTAHTAALPIAGDTAASVLRELIPIVEDGGIPVVGGYVGATKDGATTTLGRGGSDYSAAIIGAALHDLRSTSHVSTSHVSTSHVSTPHVSTPHVSTSQVSTAHVDIQIWTDVDGMLTADPRVVDSPRLVPELSFGEASELAYFGAKVLHPSTIAPAVERDIPVRILNSRRPDAQGTSITARPAPRRETLAAIACKRRITVIEVTSTRMLMAHGFMRQLFEVFERHRTAVDVVTTSEVSVSITVDDDSRLEAIVKDLQSFAEVAVEPGMALLCAVGDNLRADPKLAIRLLQSLEGFTLRMVSQASSRRNLTIVLHDRDLAGAMARLHEIGFGDRAGRIARWSATA
jgi:aspartate kinase